MATTVTKTIKSAAGDYTTVALWEADTDNDLVTADEIQVGEIYDVNPTAVLVVAGATTDATRYRVLTTAAAHRHAGVWDTAKSNWQVSSTSGKCLQLNEAFAKGEYLQIKNTHATAGDGCIHITAGTCFADQCIVWQTASAAAAGSAGIVVSGSGDNSKLRNCVSYQNHTGFYFQSGALGCEIDNCATVGNSHSGVRGDNGLDLIIKNHYSGGNTSLNYNEGGGANVPWTFTTSMSSNTESTLTGLTNSIAWSTANFTNVTAGSVDIHLVTGSALIDAGTDLSGTFTIDINGATRSGTWDVGPDEFVAAGGAAFIKMVGNNFRLAGAGGLAS
jgi:hypothetical protein